MQKLIQKWFTHGLETVKAQELTKIIADNEKAKRLFNRYAELEAALCQKAKSTEPLSVFALERGFQLIQSQLTTEKKSWSSLKTMAWASVPVAATVLLIILWLLPAKSVNRQALDSRSQLIELDLVHRGSQPSKNALVGLRVFGVTSKDKVTPKTWLTLDDQITFSVTCLSDEHRYLTLFGVQDQGNFIRYYPDPEYGEKSYILGRQDVDMPLGDGFLLSSGHLRGSLRITALFSKEPLDWSLIQKLAGQLSLSKLDPLNLPPGLEVLEHSILLNLR
jgi:hypothetical protein